MRSETVSSLGLEKLSSNQISLNQAKFEKNVSILYLCIACIESLKERQININKFLSELKQTTRSLT